MSAVPRNNGDSPHYSGVTEPILLRAGERRAAKDLPYAGEVTPAEAWKLFDAGAALIVDVRTKAEWEYVGHVPGAPLVEWRRYGDTQPNANFLRELAAHARFDDPVLFLCRSAARSHHAAELATLAGYSRAYNILEGFEGERDDQGHRGHAGWRAAGLPWEQG